jgi:hypothetical protein
MSFGCKTRAEKAWLVASLTALVLHRLLEVETGASGMWLVETAMILLTFPFGPFVMLFLAIGVDWLRAYTDAGWLIDWSTLLLAGYLQWFWVLPEIRRRTQLITLNLSWSSETSPLEINSPTKPASRSATASSTGTTSPTEIISPTATTSPTAITSPVEIPSTAPPRRSLTLPEKVPIVFNVANFVPAFAAFDEAGLTALDRVLRAEQTAPPTPEAPPSRVELIF